MSDGKLIFQRVWEDKDGGRILFSVDDSYRGLARMIGKGTMEGARMYVSILDEAKAFVGTEAKTRGIVDLRELYGAPFRAQFLLGRWLLRNKESFDRLAVFGGRPFEMKIARAIAKIARMDRIGFFDREQEALDYLEWKETPPLPDGA